jgi:hypothetical protein
MMFDGLTQGRTPAGSVTRSYTTNGSGISLTRILAEMGSSLVVEIWGRGGNGGNGVYDSTDDFSCGGGSGGSGGYTKKTYTPLVDDSLSYAYDATLSSGFLNVVSTGLNVIANHGQSGSTYGGNGAAANPGSGGDTNSAGIVGNTGTQVGGSSFAPGGAAVDSVPAGPNLAGRSGTGGNGPTGTGTITDTAAVTISWKGR